MAGRGMADERGGEGQLRREKPWAQSMIMLVLVLVLVNMSMG